MTSYYRGHRGFVPCEKCCLGIKVKGRRYRETFWVQRIVLVLKFNQPVIVRFHFLHCMSDDCRESFFFRLSTERKRFLPFCKVVQPRSCLLRHMNHSAMTTTLPVMIDLKMLITTSDPDSGAYLQATSYQLEGMSSKIYQSKFFIDRPVFARRLRSVQISTDWWRDNSITL